MSVRLTDEELEAYLATGHTLILSTIRKSGEPFLVPLWYVWHDGAFQVTTFANSSKVAHIRRDPRVCCMVEEGRDWADLRAVIANCDAEIIEDPALVAEIEAANQLKYADFRGALAKLPQASSQHYARSRLVLKMTPRPGEIRSWYNRKIRFAAEG